MIATCSSATPWPDAIAASVIAVSVAACYIAWRLTGGKHKGER